MKRAKLRSALMSTVLAGLLTAGASAQDDDVDSPSPVLISEVASTRALAVPESGIRRFNPYKSINRPFAYDSTIVIFATNISLMKGEGANAFRLYVEDVNGKKYRFPIVKIARHVGSENGTDTIYALTVRLRDQIRFWEPPVDAGDVHLALTWRGMVSNRVQLAIDRREGGVKAPSEEMPMPWGTSAGEGKAGKTPLPSYVGYRLSGDRMRFLEQATFGPTQALDDRIRRIGIRTWLAEQFEASYPSLTNPYPNQPLKPGNAPSDCDNNQTVPDNPATCFRDTYTMYQPQAWLLREALYGDAQLRHRVAWALAQVWVTSGTDVQQGRHMVEYHKVLSRNAFGNYRTLMKEMTLNATMGSYLDMARSTKNNPNENYARELMQLFTIGLFLLNPDGTYQLDNTGSPIPTYDQDTVNNLTKVLTGWTFCENTALCPNRSVGSQNYIDPLLLNTGQHDLSAKSLLDYPGVTDQNISACTGCTGSAIATYANNSMEKALDNIFNHPNVGPFVGKILIQHLVTSDPSPAYVERVVAKFNDNGLGERGDLKAVIRAILLDPEARGDTKTDPNFGKLREPVQLATNFLRQFDVGSADGLSQSDGYLIGRGEFTGMGQIPFQSPTVFNFYPPTYVVPGTAMLGPEFAILTTGTSIQRANFMNRFVFTAIPVPAAGNSPNGTSVDFSDLRELSASDMSGNRLVDELDRRMLHRTMSPAMKATLLPAITSITSGTDVHLSRARQAVYLVATSSQYQVQR